LSDLRACSHLLAVLPDQIEGEAVVYLDVEFQTYCPACANQADLRPFICAAEPCEEEDICVECGAHLAATTGR